MSIIGNSLLLHGGLNIGLLGTAIHNPTVHDPSISFQQAQDTAYQFLTLFGNPNQDLSNIRVAFIDRASPITSPTVPPQKNLDATKQWIRDQCAQITLSGHRFFIFQVDDTTQPDESTQHLGFAYQDEEGEIFVGVIRDKLEIQRATNRTIRLELRLGNQESRIPIAGPEPAATSDSIGFGFYPNKTAARSGSLQDYRFLLVCHRLENPSHITIAENTLSYTGRHSPTLKLSPFQVTPAEDATDKATPSNPQDSLRAKKWIASQCPEIDLFKHKFFMFQVENLDNPGTVTHDLGFAYQNNSGDIFVGVLEVGTSPVKHNISTDIRQGIALSHEISTFSFAGPDKAQEEHSVFFTLAFSNRRREAKAEEPPKRDGFTMHCDQLGHSAKIQAGNEHLVYTSKQGKEFRLTPLSVELPNADNPSVYTHQRLSEETGYAMRTVRFPRRKILPKMDFLVLEAKIAQEENSAHALMFADLDNRLFLGMLDPNADSGATTSLIKIFTEPHKKPPLFKVQRFIRTTKSDKVTIEFEFKRNRANRAQKVSIEFLVFPVNNLHYLEHPYELTEATGEHLSVRLKSGTGVSLTPLTEKTQQASRSTQSPKKKRKNTPPRKAVTKATPTAGALPPAPTQVRERQETNYQPTITSLLNQIAASQPPAKTLFLELGRQRKLNKKTLSEVSAAPLPVSMRFQGASKSLQSFKNLSKSGEPRQWPTLEMQFGNIGTPIRYKIEKSDSNTFILTPRDAEAPQGRLRLSFHSNQATRLSWIDENSVISKHLDAIQAQIPSLDLKSEDEGGRLCFTINEGASSSLIEDLSTLWEPLHDGEIEARGTFSIPISSYQGTSGKGIYDRLQSTLRTLESARSIILNDSICYEVKAIKPTPPPQRTQPASETTIRKVPPVNKPTTYTTQIRPRLLRSDGEIDTDPFKLDVRWQAYPDGSYVINEMMARLPQTLASLLGTKSQQQIACSSKRIASGRSTQITIAWEDIGLIEYTIEHHENQLIASRVASTIEWELSEGETLEALIDSEELVEFSLERHGNNRRPRYLVPAEQTLYFRAWLQIIGEALNKDFEEETRIEVLTFGNRIEGFTTNKLIGDILPLHSILLSPHGMQRLDDARRPITLAGAHSTLPTDSRLTTSIKWRSLPEQPHKLSDLRFHPGEALTPDKRTIEFMTRHCVTHDDRQLIILPEGQTFDYTLMAQQSGWILTLPMRFNPRRTRYPLQIDTNERIRFRRIGSDPKTENTVYPEGLLQVSHTGGHFQVFLYKPDGNGGRIKEWHLSGVISPELPFFPALVNTFDPQRMIVESIPSLPHESATEPAFVREYRAKAHKERAAVVAELLAGNDTAGSYLYFGSAEVLSSRVTSTQPIQLRYSSTDNDTTPTWVKLSGAKLDTKEPQLHFEGQLSLQRGKGLGENPKIIEEIVLVPSDNPMGQPGTCLLTEIGPDGPTNRHFIWDIEGGGISLQRQPHERNLDEASIAALLAPFEIPRSQQAADYTAKPRAYDELAAVNIDPKLPRLPVEEAAFELPSPHQIHHRSPNNEEVTAILNRINESSFIPDEDSTYAFVFNGRRHEWMRFRSPDGDIIEFPMQIDPNNKSRYIINMRANPHHGIQGARILARDPSQSSYFFDLLAVFHQVRTATINITTFIGSQQAQVCFNGVTMKDTVGRPTLGFKAWVPTLSARSGNSDTRALLRDWLEILGVDSNAPLTPAKKIDDGNAIELPDGSQLNLMIERSNPLEPYELAGIQDGAIELTGHPSVQSIQVSRSRSGGSTLYLREQGNGRRHRWTLPIDRNGQIFPINRSSAIPHFFSFAQSSRFEMIGMDGKKYNSDATSPATLRVIAELSDGSLILECRAALGREKGAGVPSLSRSNHKGKTDNSEVTQSRSAKVRFRFHVDKNGVLLSPPQGAIKSEGKQQKWQQAEVAFSDEGHRFRVYIRGQIRLSPNSQKRKQYLQDFSWLEFPSWKQLSDRTQFQVNYGHYHRVNHRGRQALPQEAGFLGMLLRNAVPNQADVIAYAALLSRQNIALHISDTLTGYQALVGALHTFGIDLSDMTLEQQRTALASLNKAIQNI